MSAALATSRTIGDRPAPALELGDLHVTFDTQGGTVRAVRGVDLEIARGEIVGLVGESGSGKTVLGLTALGLLSRDGRPQVQGSVRLDGEDVVTASEEQRRRRRGTYITAVFQDPMSSLNPAMRIGAQVAEAAGGKLAPERVYELLAETEIPEPHQKARAYPHELSGGMRQRVMIAMAFARKPALVIADEPTTALDVRVQARVLALLATRARDHGAGLLLITHDFAVAARICDRIVVMYAGRIVEAGTKDQVLIDPRHPYTVGLLASRPRVRGGPAAGELPTLAGAPPDPRRPEPGCSFAPRCPAADQQCHDEAPEGGQRARSCACHRPGALAVWPGDDRETAPVGSPTVAAVANEFQPQALVVTDLVCEYARHRSRLLAHRPAPVRAVNGASLEVPAGGSLAIVGESGSGKTTLLRAVVGLLKPTSGTVEHAQGSTPQLVFQDAGGSLTPRMRIGDQVRERLAAHGVPRAQQRQRVLGSLEAVGLPPEIARAYPRELSGGMRQRAAIARAIAVAPRLLACDEPVSALDVSLAAKVLNLLAELRAKLGLALLFVTHDLAVARAIADEVAVMHQGAIVERGPVERIFADPQHPYTLELLSAVPDLSAYEPTTA